MEFKKQDLLAREKKIGNQAANNEFIGLLLNQLSVIFLFVS